MWYNLLLLGYKPVQHVTVLNTVGNCNTVVCIILLFTLEHATKSQKGSRGIVLFFLQPRRYMSVGGQRHAPAALHPVKTRYPLYRRLGRSQGRSGRVRKISTLTGFDPLTVQPVASRYTDWAIPTLIILYSNIMIYYNIVILWAHRRICGPSVTETSLCGA
jgi:hypothetical protein